MTLIPTNYLDCVVALGVRSADKINWIGTGFFVGKLIQKNPKDKTHTYAIFLVTNKHIIKNVSSVIMRFSLKGKRPVKEVELNFFSENNEDLRFGHPDPDVDVAVVNFSTRELFSEDHDAIGYNIFRSDEHIKPLTELNLEGLFEGDFVYVLGYPMELVNINRPTTIVRSGVIARIRDIFEGYEKSFLIDVPTYPGNSGSPVIFKPEIACIEGTKCIKDAYLIGIINSHISYVDVAISIQTQRPRVTFEENSGLTNVFPVDLIMETIELFMKSKTIQERK